MGIFIFAQSKSNPFDDSEIEKNNELSNAYAPESPAHAPDVSNATGPPGDGDPDPVPIDNYLPVLLITASGMIVYFARKRKELKF